MFRFAVPAWRRGLSLAALSLALSGCAGWLSPSQPAPAAAPAAAPAGASAPMRFINPPGTEAVGQRLGFSQAVRAGDWLLVSGQVGYDPATGEFPRDFSRQAELAFEHLRATLAAAGATLDDVAEITTYQLNMRRFNELIKLRNAAFGEHRPAWTAVGVKALVEPQAQFEISARVYLPR